MFFVLTYGDVLESGMRLSGGWYAIRQVTGAVICGIPCSLKLVQEAAGNICRITGGGHGK